MVNETRQNILDYIRKKNIYSLNELCKHFSNDIYAINEISNNVLYYSLLLNENKPIPNETSRIKAGSGKWLATHTKEFEKEYELVLEGF